MFSSLDRTPAVKHLLIINVLVFIVMNFVPQVGVHFEMFAMHYFDHPEFGFWQLVTHMFLHGSLMHLGFNMFVLFQFGPVLEQHWGTKKFVFFYFIAGLGAALFYTLNLASVSSSIFHTLFPVTEGLLRVSPNSQWYAVGASGAISGIVAAFAYLHPNTKLMLMFIPVPVKAKYLVGGFFVYDLVMGIMNSLNSINANQIGYSLDNIAHWAHLGGAVFGILLLFYWQKNSRTFY